jgi:hypothetical protein
MSPQSPEEYAGRVFLGTVAIEPNRWGMAKPGGFPVTVVSDWIAAIAAAGFDGLELWERHATFVEEPEVERIASGPLPVEVFNGYALWDEPDPSSRDETAVWIDRLGARAVKFNVGNDPASRGAYVERLRAFEAKVAGPVRLLCECHPGTLAEDPKEGSAMFDEVAPADRLQAVVHVGRTPDGVAPMTEAMADRVGHVHVQLPEAGPDVEEEALAADLRVSVELLRSFGFDGSWTIEFSYGRMTEDDEAGYILRWATRDLRALRAALEP